ncbi:helix-turn-helix domain-containing protein [Exilibacterium tricleocarpae]|uniref:helix-turn-helix domain-containing protein n=1 Tax=Exilibacterium tricleocarpae TaxID=2591008 RepID=UPI001C553069|nr:helix-turn-helix domain-containing protein [Exilibacterium tricleocarpae]
MIALLGLNLAELASFSFVANPRAGAVYLTAYYIFAIGTCLALLGLSLEIGGYLKKTVTYVILACAIVCITIVAIPKFAIADVESIGYSITRIPGPAYWLIKLTIFTALIGSLVIMIYCTRTNPDRVRQRRAFVLAVATGPSILAVSTVLAFMQMNIPINAAGIVSLTINLLLFVLLWTESQPHMFRLLALIPKTEEHRKINRMKTLLFSPNLVPLKKTASVFEQMVVDEAIHRCDGNKAEAARRLGISRNTLARKLKT